MTEPDISMVCFDLGGVVIKLRKSWADVCQAAGFEVRGESDSDRAEDARHQVMAPYVLGRISHQEWAEKTALVLGGVYSAEELGKIHDAWLLDEYAGVAEIVGELRARGIATACLSNTNHAHWENCLRAERYPAVAGLGERFASHLLGCSKPDAAIFRAFERHTGHAAARVLFFDDLGMNVEAARSCGWRAERIDPGAETAPQIRSHLAGHRVLAARAV